MALSYFNGVRAHHSFFVCSWFIIVQNQSFVHKSFIWSQSKPYLQSLIGTSISMAITLCRHGSHEHRGRFRNHFRCCATLLIMLRFINLIEFHCPPTQIFREKQFLGNKQETSTNTFVFDFIVERIPNLFSGITNKDIHPILVVNSFTYAMHTKI